MPPKRRTSARPSQQHPQPTQSDYDTDTPAQPLQPLPPPTRTNTELNTLVLRRYHPTLTSILSIAPFAVIYTFSPLSQTWEKNGVEGTLFVCQLDDPVTREREYKVTILNRKALDTWSTELISAEDVEVTEQYVILQTQGRDGEVVVYGLWIFEDGEGEGGSRRESVAGVIASCALLAQEAKEAKDVDGDGVYGDSETGYEDETVASAEVPVHTAQHGQSQYSGTQVGQHLDLLQLFAKSPAPARDQYATMDAPSLGVSTPAPVLQQKALLDLFKR